jgi:hypothetical protein
MYVYMVGSDSCGRRWLRAGGEAAAVRLCLVPTELGKGVVLGGACRGRRVPHPLKLRRLGTHTAASDRLSPARAARPKTRTHARPPCPHATGTPPHQPRPGKAAAANHGHVTYHS